MEIKNNKTLVLNTLLFAFCVGVIALFCFGPTNKVAVLEEYNVVFDTDGGSAIAAIMIEEGGLIQQPEAPTKEGYIFVGWMLGDELYDFAAGVTGDVTLKAVWEERLPDVNYYTISFSTGGGSSVTPITIAEGNIPNTPIPPIREGFTFVEWQLNGLTYTFTEPVTEDITLVAVWEIDATEPEEPTEPGEQVTTYVVTFMNDGKAYRTSRVEEGKTVGNPGNPSKSGYNFLGWYYNGSKYNFSTPVKSNMTITAQWQQIPKKTYFVYFLSYYGTHCQQRSVTEGGTISNIPNGCADVRDGYKHIGWSTTKGSSTTNFSSSTQVKSELTLYPVYQARVYTVKCVRNSDATGNATSCTVQIFEDGVQIFPSKIYIGDKPVNGSVNIPSVWDKISSVTFDYGTLKNHIANKAS